MLPAVKFLEGCGLPVPSINQAFFEIPSYPVPIKNVLYTRFIRLWFLESSHDAPRKPPACPAEFSLLLSTNHITEVSHHNQNASWQRLFQS